MIRLKIETPTEKRELDLEGPSTLGRSRDNTIVLDEKRASRRHAKIEIVDGRVTLIDLESANGTKLNGQKVERAALSVGDVIQVGEIQLTVLALAASPEPAAAQEIQAHDPVPVEEKYEVKRKIQGRLSAMGEERTSPAALAARAVAGIAVVAALGGVVYYAATHKAAPRTDVPAVATPGTTPAPGARQSDVLARLAILRGEVEHSPHVTQDHVFRALRLATDALEAFPASAADATSVANPVSEFHRDLAIRRAQFLSGLYAGAESALQDAIDGRGYALATGALARLEQEGGSSVESIVRSLDSRLREVMEADYLETRAQASRFESWGLREQAEEYVRGQAVRFAGTGHEAELLQLARDVAARRDAPSAPVAQATPAGETSEPETPAVETPATPADEPAAPVAELPTLEGLRARFADELNAGELGRVTLPLDQRRWIPVSAGGDGVLFMFRDEERRIPWAEITAEHEFALLAAVHLTDDERLLLVQFAFDRSLAAQAHAQLYEYWGRRPDRKPTIDGLLAAREGREVPEDGYVWDRRLEIFEHPITRSNRLAREDAKEDCERLARADAEREVARLFEKVFAVCENADLLEETRRGVRDDLIAALGEYKGGRLERLAREARQISTSWQNVTRVKEILEEGREAAIAVIYDRTIYPDENHGIVGQPRVNEVVTVVREVWGQSVQAQLPEPIQNKILDVLRTNREFLSRLGADPAEELGEYETFINNMIGTQTVTIRDFAATGQERRVLNYNEAVSAYNRQVFAVPEGCPRDIVDQIEVLNDYRAMMGRPKLFLDARLCRAAQKHAEAQAAAGAIWHEGPNGTPSSRCAEEGFTGPVGENCAMGFETPEAAHEAWYNSSGHHRNMLSDGWNTIGVGHAGGTFWVQDFGVTDVPREIHELEREPLR